MSYQDFDLQWQKRRSDGLSLLDSLGVLDDEAAETRARIESTLAEGRFNLILAVDAINDPLRDIVEYLNAHTAANTAVLAMEFKRFTLDQEEVLTPVEVLVPAVYGIELVESKPGRKRRRWTEEEFINEITRQNPELLITAISLLDGMKALGLEFQGTPAQTPSLAGRTRYGSAEILPLALYASKKPSVQINFGALPAVHSESKAACAELLARLPECKVDAVVLAAADFNKYPNIPIDSLHRHMGAVEAFLNAVEVLIRPIDNDRSELPS
jgi:hypothetical protein